MRIPSFTEVKAGLRALFSEEAAKQTQETARREVENARQLARLGAWLTETAGRLRQELDKPTTGKPSLGSSATSIDIDASVFSAEELKTIEPQYVLLHDLCLNHNVSLEIAGFDRLPGKGTGTNHTWRKARAVTIEVDGARTYNGHSHPHYFELRQAGVKLPLSMDRPEARTCSLS